jgi:hypothetical protein
LPAVIQEPHSGKISVREERAIRTVPRHKKRCSNKTAAAIYQEVAREIDALLRVIFIARHKTVTPDLEKTELSPGLRRMLTRVGSECSYFERGREQDTIEQALQRELPIAVGQAISVMYVQMDGTGVPIVTKEVEGRTEKGNNGRAHTREVKLGCVLTQSKVDAEGWPVRDEDSTTYMGAIETAEELSRRLDTEAQRRNWDRAQKKVVMGDSAEWIWNLAQQIVSRSHRDRDVA